MRAKSFGPQTQMPPCPARRISKWAQAAAFFATLTLTYFHSAFTHAASPPERWVQHIPYDPPNSSHEKIQFSGTDATQIPNSGGNVLLKAAMIKQFAITGGDAQMTAEAPECVLDHKRSEVTSAGPLKVHAEAGKFYLEGTGFALDYGQLTLNVSNDVKSLLQIQMGTNGVAAPATEISSKSARFEMRNDATNGLAIYRRNVRVMDPKMKITGELLTADLPRNTAGETNRPNHIYVETNVVIDFVTPSGEPLHATGEKAAYTSKSPDGTVHELLELTGSPRVELTNGWMTADSFVMDQTIGKLRATGNFHFHYLGQTGPANRNIAAGSTDLFADRFEYEMATHIATFWTGVRVEDPQLKLNSEFLTALLPQQETNKQQRIDHIVAETNVVIDMPENLRHEKLHAIGQKAVYDYKVHNVTTNQVLTLTGNPSVEISRPDGAGWMTSDTITVDSAQGRIWGAGNHHSVFKKDPREPATMDTEVFSEQFDYTVETGLAVYHENVRAYDPLMNATAAKMMSIKLAKSEPGKTSTNKIDSMRADGNVTFDFLEQAFYPKDITNLTTFAARLNRPANPVDEFVSANLSTNTHAMLVNYTNGTNVAFQAALVGDLNRIVQRGTLYEPARFSKISVSPETTALLQRQPLGVDLVELNRLLLLDAYRGLMARNQNGEKTHATGERAAYDYTITGNATNEVLELSGHPRVEQPSRWSTADDKIVYNRTTHLMRGVGNFRGGAVLQGLKTMPAKSPKKAAK